MVQFKRLVMKPVVAVPESENDVTDLNEVGVENGLPSLMYSKCSRSLLEKILPVLRTGISVGRLLAFPKGDNVNAESFRSSSLCSHFVFLLDCSKE